MIGNCTGKLGIMLFTRRIVRYGYKASLCAKGKAGTFDIYVAHTMTNENGLWDQERETKRNGMGHGARSSWEWRADG